MRHVARLLKRWSAAARIVERDGAGRLDEVIEAGLSRRGFVGGLARGAALGALAVSMPGLRACATRTGREGREGGEGDGSEVAEVAIVGAGLAGLSACHVLAKRGIVARVFEAKTTVGGRTRSLRGFMGAESPIELGAEFIDSEHEDLLALVSELGLSVFDARPSDAPALDTVYWVGGRRVSEREIAQGFVPLARKVLAARASLQGDAITYRTPLGAEALDRTSLADFLASSGASEVTRRVLEAAYVTEYGMDLEHQSALNLLMVMEPDDLREADASAALSLYGSSDERWKVEGGNQRVCEVLAERYRDRVQVDRVLVALRQRPGGHYTLSFADGTEVSAARVILTVPFSVLRSVDLSGVGLPALKRRVIAELGYGTNAKLIVPFSRRPWLERGEDGSLYADGAVQSTWDPHLRRPGERGFLTRYVGGGEGVALGQGTPDEHARALATALDPVWSLAEHRLDGAVRAHWPSDPFARGSYAGYHVGQWTSLGGAEAEAVGGLHFAGEHTSADFQGFMEGAVASGYRAAREILDGVSASSARVFSGRMVR